MGLTYAEIQLFNEDDRALCRRKLLGEEEIRSMHINALVDTGAIYMCINEAIQEALGLESVEERVIQTATGAFQKLNVSSPIEIRFKNRRCVTSAIILPDNSEPLLGAIPMEDMDVVISPLRQTLEVHPDHPDMAVMKIKKI